MTYYFTRRAFEQLIEIQKRSLQDFGKAQTTHYLKEIYQGFADAANNSDRDDLRTDRSSPFSMQAVGPNHFAIYHRFDGYIIIAAIFGQAMDVERHIERLKTRLGKEISLMRQDITRQGSNPF
jgi:plasmid stabilization system protein ParE